MCLHPTKATSDRSTPAHWPAWLMPAAGLVALIWFLVRVVPEPSRAAYPCQRAAAPLASAFVLWLLGVGSSLAAWRRGRAYLTNSRLLLAGGCAMLAVAAALVSVTTTPARVAWADPVTPNQPIGVARGLHPGRVTWMHDPAATDWTIGDGHWWESTHTSQQEVDHMLSSSLRQLTGSATDSAAWDALFRSYNQTHGRGDVGLLPGEKVAIKVNLVGMLASGGNVDPVTYELVGKIDYMNTSPQVMLALLRQLVDVAGVAEADIAIGDPVALFANQYFTPLHNEFPSVVYLDAQGGSGRTAAVPSSVDLYWSSKPTGVSQDKVLTAYAEATYFINLANLKSHSAAGITACGKNYYGWLRTPPAAGYFDLHTTIPTFRPAAGSYRAVVDLMGHADSGGKAVLYLIDGLYAGVHPDDSAPIRWAFAQFNGDWTSSLFASQDPVAIDSVAFDFLQQEGDPRAYPQLAGTDDYLSEAALADNPPSGTFYDPDHAGDVTRLQSLGTHEHWDNPSDMRYSRNLDPANGQGIELVQVHRVFADAFEGGDSGAWSATRG